jgi:hypothetical protein
LRRTADRLGLPLIDIRLAQREPADLGGVYFPDRDRQVLSLYPPDWVRQACEEPCLVFLDEINAAFPQTDVALVIGANDVVNPSARTNPDSPIYGMPILNADQAKNVIVIKRGQGKGFSGVENALFFGDNTRMLYGDGQAMVGELIEAVKEL